MQFYADLDELILRCRNADAQKNIAEAVSCYKAGAFRSCIVSTWIAVVFDFIHKLRELELTGDNQARQNLKDFGSIHKDIQESLKFERNLLDKALRYEFISSLEYADLKRLQEDRNRCAHPSVNSTEEAYQPSAELARYHLRSAITHPLQHPPVQGKAALSRLVAEVDSQYFPKSTEDAVRHFSHGPLASPREALVRNFLMVLIKKILLDDTVISEEEQAVAAIKSRTNC